MDNFLRNSDLIGNSYQNITQGNRLVYDILTKKNVFFLGFYWHIDNLEEYREFAKKYVPGAREYEELRISAVSDIIKYRDEIFQYGLKQDESRIAKLTNKKQFCQNPIVTLLNLGQNIDRNCIYNAAGLRVIRVLKGAVLATAYDSVLKSPAMSNVLIYTKKKYADYELLNENLYIYYTKFYSYKSLYNQRTVNAFAEFNIDDYPFLNKKLRIRNY
jgi:hypothetical protein